MSIEAAVGEQHPAYRPDDPEFYMQDEGQQSPVAGSVRVLGGVAFSVARLVTLNCAWAPVNRFFLLQCAEGGLVQNGRLPHGGFSGMRGCVLYILKKEGTLGFFRGGLTDMVLSMPAYLVRVAVALWTARLQQWLAVDSWPAAVVFGVAAPGLRVLLTAPIVGAKNTVLCNYTADIVAPSSNKVAVNAEEEEEEAYLYCSAGEAAAAVRACWGWKGVCFRGLDVDIAAVYAQSLTLQLIGRFLTPHLGHLIGEQIQRPWQAAAMIAAAIGVRFICSFLFQPFQVIRVRMTLLSTGGKQKPKPNRWFWHYAREIMRQDGITAFWAGFRMRLLLDVTSILFGTLVVH
ncbi:ADP/ATP translocase [Trypanosoma rangeli]|uniref:ADP/ATP translocase n=1 Tax=Trypanosoma rangeli TaxID=5698 RepID=A0A3R7NBU8_TRYRA|nr:ADP/ATP translocase [Trypanosoma rangeli]RNF00266.1 ADP/ATP translocase [Trypanosoma rangeli]|eukprot:RNF00266.1 ADP/ATP translocase [Trypanosoma rangeli]